MAGRQCDDVIFPKLEEWIRGEQERVSAYRGGGGMGTGRRRRLL